MSIKFYGKSSEVAEKIIKQFETGDLPAALSKIFVKRSDNIPASSWSWRNQFIIAISGAYDARGFRQWEKAGRKVSKGSKALHILGPCVGKRKEKDDNGNETEVSFVYGFKSIPVFALESTELTDDVKWQEASGVDRKEEDRLKSLPLREVAELWGLNITSYNGKGAKFLGYYKHGQTIALGIKNLATWAHELVHAADDRLGKLSKSQGQNPENEIVAALGSAVLLKIMGYEIESDAGGAWNYVKAYARNDKTKALGLCGKLIDRVCTCVDLIITTSSEIEPVKRAA